MVPAVLALTKITQQGPIAFMLIRLNYWVSSRAAAEKEVLQFPRGFLIPSSVCLGISSQIILLVVTELRFVRVTNKVILTGRVLLLHVFVLKLEECKVLKGDFGMEFKD